jgi:hypothetical protein
MLVAEIHGHIERELANNEDYLTSTVFGHLRYIPPTVFWTEFFSRAAGVPLQGHESTLLDSLTRAGVQLRDYETLDARFWPSFASFGTPDLVLCFSGPESRSLICIIEAKLWSGKSGFGEHDQLLRYLRLLDRPENLFLPLRSGELRSAFTALLYLTPRESLPELIETSNLCSDRPDLSARLFRAQWQDLAAAAETSFSTTDRRSGIILRDVAAFLRTRGLEHFRGYRRPALPIFAPTDGRFYESLEFSGFSKVSLLSLDASAGSFYAGSQRFAGFHRWEGPLPLSRLRGGWME